LNPAIHQEQPVLTYGTPLDRAQAAVILMHGRGATAQSMLGLAEALAGANIAYLMPQAANNVWYPNSGFAPLAVNEPYLTSAMQTIDLLLARVEAAGIPLAKTALGGFSQGAVLSSEYAARHAKRYGGLLLFSGALMGPEGTPREYPGSFDGTPVFLGGLTQDPWVKETQLRETADVLTRMGAEVTLDIVPGSNHGIRDAEITLAQQIINNL
jgi:predicted esterase